MRGTPPAIDSTTATVCGECSTGCGLCIHLRDGEAIGLTPDASHPVNLGIACSQGLEALNALNATNRATEPLVRRTDGRMYPASWQEALTRFTSEFKRIQSTYGAESIAVLSNGQLTCEEMVMLGVLARMGMGVEDFGIPLGKDVDHAAKSYKRSFGFDAPPYTYDDLEQSDCLVFVGVNPLVKHPVLWERVLRNPRNPEIIVLDPDRTETAKTASQHLQLHPKTDLTLLYGITQQIIEHGFVDRVFVDNHTQGYDELAAYVSTFTLDSVAEATGLTADAIQAAAKTIGAAGATSLWWTTDNSRLCADARTAQAIVNIALITGNIGRPGTGANGITGQCNALGSRLWSNTATLLGHHQFESNDSRQKVAEVLRLDVATVPSKPSLPFSRILQSIRDGEIRGLWVIATNGSHSWMDRKDAREVLDRLDVLVVQDMDITTDLASLADVLLPTAGWGEKEGTLINNERRYSVLKRLRQSPGESRPDFEVFRAVAEHWGVGDMFESWDSPEAVFQLMKQLSHGQFCDITGIQDYGHLDRCGGIQWPWSEADAIQASGCDPQQQRRLFANGYFPTSNGRANLMVDTPPPVPEYACSDYPFVLLTGRRTVRQLHAENRTSKGPALNKLYPSEAYIEIHPEDAAECEIQHNDHVLVQSRRGSLIARACLTQTVMRGQVFLPMHYDTVNRLTLTHFDPYSRQSRSKDCAVRIERATRTHLRSK